MDLAIVRTHQVFNACKPILYYGLHVSKDSRGFSIINPYFKLGALEGSYLILINACTKNEQRQSFCSEDAISAKLSEYYTYNAYDKIYTFFKSFILFYVH